MKLFSSKSNAKRAATKLFNNLDNIVFHKNEAGKWFIVDDSYVEPSIAPSTAEGLKIEKDRPEHNGIRRPSVGGKCRAVWDACDDFYKSGKLPMPKQMKAWAEETGTNPNNAVIEMYQWRKYNGHSK